MRHLNCEFQDTARLYVIKEEQWIEHYKMYGIILVRRTHQKKTRKVVDEISVEELAIQGLKNREAPGLDGVNSELFKYGGTPLKLRLLHLLNLCWKYCIIPNAWQKAKLISLFKKG